MLPEARGALGYLGFDAKNVHSWVVTHSVKVIDFSLTEISLQLA